MTDSLSRYNQRIMILAILGAGISGWLLSHHVEVTNGFQIGQSFCDFSSFFNCTGVAQSEYSELFGVPVAAWSILYFVAFILLLLAFSPQVQSAQKGFAAVILLYSAVGLIPTLIYAAVSLLVLRSVCSMCAMIYVISIIIFCLSWRSPALRGSRTGLGAAALGFVRCISVNAASVGSLVFLLLLALGLLQAESILINSYFQPRSESLQAETTLRPIYDAWLAAPVVNSLVEARVDGPYPDFFKGGEDAEFTLVEFSDFQCPHCQRASLVVAEIVASLPAQVKFVFKNFPLDSACNERIPKGQGHEFACKAALMIRCAGLQDSSKFWEMHDAIFALSSWSDEELDLLAEELALDTQAFTNCLAGAEALGSVQTDIADGLEAGVRGTPSFFLNGKRLEIQDLRTLLPFLKFALAQQPQ